MNSGPNPRRPPLLCTRRSGLAPSHRPIGHPPASRPMKRLLTLTGAGGCGKTRLALKVARDLVGAYPEGAWLVDLAPLSEAELVEQAVAQALGVNEQPGRPLVETLKDSLRSRKMLLVVDNCE